MKIEIIGKNYKPADRLKEIIEKKLQKFSKYFGDDTKVKVVLKEIGANKFAMEVSVVFDGSNLIRSEVVSDNMYDNIDIVLPKLERQVRKYKTKQDKKKKEQPLGQLLFAAEVDLVSPELVKKKTIDLERMTVEDAAYALEMIGHGFYLFTDKDTGKVSVVYMRNDGDIGHLELMY